MRLSSSQRGAAPSHVLDEHTLFKGLTANEAAAWLARGEAFTLEPGEVLFREGEQSDSFFLIEEGELEILRDPQVVLTTLGPGAEVGAMGVVDGAARSATARARTPLRIRRFDGSILLPDPVPSGGGDVRAIVLRNLFRQNAERLRDGNERQLQLLEAKLTEERRRAQLGSFTAYAIALMCLYGMSLELGQVVINRTGDSAPFTVACLVVFVGALYWMIRRSGEPRSHYGLSLRGAPQAMGRAALLTLPLLGALTALKAAAIALLPSLSDEPLFEFELLVEAAPLGGSLWLLLYILFTPAQEFVARGALQGSLRQFLLGPRAGLKANVLANLMFASSHLHMSTGFTLLVIPPGLFWGWLFERERILLAPIVSHLILGIYAIFILGIPGVG